MAVRVPSASTSSHLFPGFEVRDDDVGGEVHVVVGGIGPPVLLLHGYPQSHLMWHAVCPALAAGHTVVAGDLAGSGASLGRV